MDKIDISKLIIGKEKIGANEINVEYLKMINKNKDILIQLNEDRFEISIYLRNSGFRFIRNLVFKTKLYKTQYKRILKLNLHKIKNKE